MEPRRRRIEEIALSDGGGIPRLGFGTFELGGDVCRRAVLHALTVGYRHIDTAAMYENEAEVGQAIAAADVVRERIFLTTKVWWEDLSPREVRRSATDSLRRLGTGYVDLFLIHWPNPDDDLRATLDTMLELQAEGRVRHLGVSNFNPSRLRRAADLAPLVCNQVEYHPLLAQRELLDIVHERGLVLTAYSPLAQGKVLGEETVADIARRHGREPAQVALRWLLQQDGVVAIPRSADPAHIEANFDVLDFELDDDDMQAIHGLARGERLVDPEWAPEWSH